MVYRWIGERGSLDRDRGFFDRREARVEMEINLLLVVTGIGGFWKMKMLASFLENMDLVCLEYVESNGNFLVIQEM